MSKPILITGCQRSGTSMVAGVMFYLGVYMTDTFLARDKYNPLGYFESIEFGHNDAGRYLKHITKDQWAENLKQLLAKYSQMDIGSQGFSKWGWKNPSATDFIKDVIKIAKPDIVWCQRREEENLESMRNMHWEHDAEIQHKEKMEAMEEVKDKCYIVKMEDMIENTEYEIGRLVGHFKLKPSKQQLKKAIRHVVKKPDKTLPSKEESYMNYL